MRILPAEPDAFLRGRGGLARSALAITPVVLILQESPVLSGESLSLCREVSWCSFRSWCGISDFSSAVRKSSVRVRILPAEPDAFLRGRGGLARSALAITPVKCQNVLLLAALHSQKPSFATAFPDPPGVAGSSGRILEFVSGSQLVFFQK
ncbi:hypothetical protein DV702_03670 [Sporosarcina sp. PTS2304]|nr:hypothetical protein DV702_03670 [Sporosarcina sp. PTS2304]